eukprot:1099351-Rhodomonas_salina.4
MRQRPGWLRGLTLLARSCEASGCEWGAVAALQHIKLGGGVVCADEHDEWGRKVDQDYYACLKEFIERKLAPMAAASGGQFANALWTSAIGLEMNPPSMVGLPDMKHPDKVFAQLMYLQFARAEGIKPKGLARRVGETLEVQLSGVLGDHLVMCPLMNFLVGNYAVAERELGHLVSNFELFESDVRRDDLLQKLIEPAMRRLQLVCGRAAIMAKVVRCVARLELGDGGGALADAKCCVAFEPQWIRSICLLSRAYLASGMAGASALAGMHGRMLWKIIDKADYEARYFLDPKEDMDSCLAMLEGSTAKMVKAKRKIKKQRKTSLSGRPPKPASERPVPPSPAKAPPKKALEEMRMFSETMVMLVGIDRLQTRPTLTSPASVVHILPDATSLDWSGRQASPSPSCTAQIASCSHRWPR